jgi:hypothetical protein
MQRVAASLLECEILTRLPMIVAAWRDPAEFARDDGELARMMTNTFVESARRAGPLWREAVRAAVEESFSLLPEGSLVKAMSSADSWTAVLLEKIGWHITWPRNEGDGGNVVDLGTWVLARLARP